MAIPATKIKYFPVQVFQNQALDAVSPVDLAVDCSQVNAVHVDVYVGGSGPSADITVLGSYERGGQFLALPDINASQTAVSANLSFDCVVGQRYVRIQLANIAAGSNFTIYVTPYISAGSPRVSVNGIWIPESPDLASSSFSIGGTQAAPFMRIAATSGIAIRRLNESANVANVIRDFICRTSLVSSIWDIVVDSYYDNRFAFPDSGWMVSAFDGSFSRTLLQVRAMNLDTGAFDGGTYVKYALKVSGNVGFYDTDPQTKPAVTGSRGGNAALASLLTGLAGLGLITDSSVA